MGKLGGVCKSTNTDKKKLCKSQIMAFNVLLKRKEKKIFNRSIIMLEELGRIRVSQNYNTNLLNLRQIWKIILKYFHLFESTFVDKKSSCVK